MHGQPITLLTCSKLRKHSFAPSFFPLKGDFGEVIGDRVLAPASSCLDASSRRGLAVSSLLSNAG
jgi:hypothetical protein